MPQCERACTFESIIQYGQVTTNFYITQFCYPYTFNQDFSTGSKQTHIDKIDFKYHNYIYRSTHNLTHILI